MSKRSIYILFAVVATLVALLWGAGAWLRGEMESQLHSRTDGKYTFDIDGFSINPISRSVSLRGVTITDSIGSRHIEIASFGVKGISVGYGNFSIKSLDIDGVTLAKGDTVKNMNIYSGEISLDIKMGRYSISDLEYRYNLGTLTISELAVDCNQGLLKLKSLLVDPIYPKEEYAKSTPDHRDWSRYSLDSLSAFGIEYDKLLSGGDIVVEHIAVAGANIQSYKNRQIDQAPQLKSILYEALQGYPRHIALGLVIVDGLDVTYQELPPKGREAGTISINNISASLLGVNNRAAQGKYFTIEAEAMVQDKGELEVTISMPNNPLDTTFTAKGHLGRMDLSAFNSITEPLGRVEITGGKLSGLTFDIKGSSYGSHVNLTMLYDDLGIMIVKDKDGHYKDRKLLSAIVEEFFVIPSNPHRGKTIQGSGSFERDPYKSQFNYLWKSLLPGLKTTLLSLPKRHHKKRK